CIAPASVWFTKQLPQHKWVEFIQQLPKDLTIYVLGAKGDRRLANSIEKNCPEHECHNLAGQLTLLQSAALIQDATLTYTNDSAPMHLASAMNAPVAAVFCSTVPAFGFGPLSDQSYVIETSKQLSCRPCGLHGKKRCSIGDFTCAESINTSTMVRCLSKS
ncbi:MAG: glycosyltransferase family 9 protein, partial [Chitinophagales bacterium]